MFEVVLVAVTLVETGASNGSFMSMGRDLDLVDEVPSQSSVRVMALVPE